MSKSVAFSRRNFLRLAALSTAGSALAACAPAAPVAPTQAPAGQATPTAAPPAEGKVTIRFWSHNNPAFVKTNEQLVKKYMDANPTVDVKYENFPYDQLITTIQTQMAAKTEADVIEMFGSWVQSYAKGGTLAEMPGDLMTLATAHDKFFAAPLDGYVWNGKLFGLPNEYNLENGGVLVNKKMFEAAGLQYPPTWASWDELVTQAKKLVKMDGNTMTVAGFDYVTNDGLGFLFWEGILERGGEYFDKDGVHLNFLTDQATATVQWLVDMAIKDKIVDPLTFNADSNWVGDSFFQNLVGIGYIGPWIVPVSRENHADYKDPWDYVSCPHVGEKMSFAADAGWGKVVSPNSKAIQKAWDFTLFWTNKPESAYFWNVGTGTVPALKSVAEDPQLTKDMNWLGPSLKVLPYGRYVGMLQDRDFVWYKVVAAHITEALQGKRSVAETMTLMNTEANAMIDSKIK